MDPKLVTLLADYMEKTGSISADTRNLVDRMYRHIDRQDTAKTASIAALTDKAGELAQKMTGIRMLSGQPLIEGYEMVKQAAAMMIDHDQALQLLDMVLDTINLDRQKQASLEPGRACPSTSKNADELSAIDGLMADCGITA
ncbi:MAG TPA: hypothetical protein DEB39_11480 [Planctomycetaceae bacterium]|nr:hypothetical protein [Planctomycetaceae bacterium]